MKLVQFFLADISNFYVSNIEEIFSLFQYRGNVLKIHSVKKEDRGTYYCVADNGVGKPARRNVAVEVEFPPSIEGGGRKGQALGYSVELVCSVEAYPRPTITWVHDGIQLSTNQVCTLANGQIISVANS